MTRIYIPVDVTAPIACTVTSPEISLRIEQIEHMRDRLLSIERTAEGLVLYFTPDDELLAQLEDFAVAEKGCCQFWGFEIDRTTRLTLRWNGPDEAQPILDKLLGYFEGDEPLTAFAGLL